MKRILQMLFLSMVLTVAAIEPEEPPLVPEPPSYTSGGVVILCADTGLMLYGSEYHTQFYPASITKIMTALVVLDHAEDLNERIPFSHNAVFSIPRNSSHIAMDVGETLTVTEALYAMMVSSANEVSIALAEHIAGSVEEFVTLMNHRAVSLGAMNTNFVNPTGLPATGHVTTAYDMALIKREAVRLYPLYNKIIATRQFVIPPTERQPESRFLNTTNQMIRPGTAYFDGRVIGGKTGWTHAAGNTLVTYAVHEGRRLIVSILLGSGTTPYRETTALLDYAFDLPYEDRVVFHAASYIRTVPVYQNINGETTEIYRLSLKADKDLTYSLPVGFGLDRLSYELNVPTGLTAPVTEGDTIGNVAVSIQNIPLGTVALLAQTTVEPLPVSLPAEPIVDEPLYTTAPPEPVPYTQNSPTYNNFWDTLRNSEQLSALAVPITVSFFGLLFSIIIFAARRRRKMSKFFYIGSGGGKRYTTPYRYR